MSSSKPDKQLPPPKEIYLNIPPPRVPVYDPNLPEPLYPNQMRCTQCGGFEAEQQGLWGCAIQWSYYFGWLALLCAGIDVGSTSTFTLISLNSANKIRPETILTNAVFMVAVLVIGLGPFALTYVLQPKITWRCLHCGYFWRQRGRQVIGLKWTIFLLFMTFVGVIIGAGPFIMIGSMSLIGPHS